MAHYKKSKKSKKSLLNKGLTTIKKSTQKIAPRIKTGLESIGSKIISSTVPRAQSFLSKMGIKKSKKYSKSRKSRKSRKNKK